MSPEVLADVIVSTVKQTIAPVLARLDTSDARLAALETSAAVLGDLRERVAAVEARPPIPGPPGIAGADGKNGADGLGFDDLAIEFDGERTLAFRFTRGDTIKTFPIALPFMRYQGVYQEGYPYVVGDVVTAGGNAWHCQTPTTFRPGENVEAWRLMVRKGRDAREVVARG